MLISTLAFCALSLCVSQVAAAKTKTAPQPLDGIAAIVNDSIITQSELNDALSIARKQLAASNASTKSSADLHNHVLDQLVDKRLQLELAQAAGMKITDEQLDKAVDGIAKQNNISADELFAKLSSEGMTKESYMREIHDEMLIQQLEQQQVGSKIAIAPQEVNDFMHSKSWQANNNKEYHLEDILIPFPITPTPQDIQAAKREGQDVLAEFNKGITAQDIITGEATTNHTLQGGDVGWVKVPQIPPAIVDKIIHMAANQVLGPLQTPNGFHVIHLMGTRAGKSTQNMADARKQVEQLIFQRKLNEGVQTWLAKIRSEAYIKKTAVG